MRTTLIVCLALGLSAPLAQAQPAEESKSGLEQVKTELARSKDEVLRLVEVLRALDARVAEQEKELQARELALIARTSARPDKALEDVMTKLDGVLVRLQWIEQRLGALEQRGGLPSRFPPSSYPSYLGVPRSPYNLIAPSSSAPTRTGLAPAPAAPGPPLGAAEPK
jgi:hypothetical protein